MTTTETRLQKLLDPQGRAGRFGSSDMLELLPRIECADGFSLSIQTGRTHYCHPRDNNGPWHAAEVGFPSARAEEFMPYIDGQDGNPTDTVYGYVPLSIIAAVIDQHGGIKSAAA